MPKYAHWFDPLCFPKGELKLNLKILNKSPLAIQYTIILTDINCTRNDLSKESKADLLIFIDKILSKHM